MTELHRFIHAHMPQFIRFCVSGCGATIFHTAVVFATVHGAGLSAALANFCAFLVAAIFSYAVNTLWSFKSALTKLNAVRFFFSTSICAVMAAAIASAMDRAGFSLLTGIFAVVVLLTPLSFLLHKHWTFAPNKDST